MRLAANEQQVLKFMTDLQTGQGIDQSHGTPAELEPIRTELLRRLGRRRRDSGVKPEIV